MNGVRRLELALALLAASAVLVAVIVALDALRFHLPQLLAGTHGPPGGHELALALLAALDALVLWRLGPSLWRQVRLQRRLYTLHVLGERQLAGHAVSVVRDARPVAFCRGLLRPALFVSDGALAALGERELDAVVQHEAHHARRRDPLRLLAAQTAEDAFGFLPPLRGLAQREAALADLAADRAAVAAIGSPAPLAGAMLAFEDPAPERVDHLLGRPLAAVAPGALAAAAVAVAGLATLLVCHLVLPGHPVVPAWALPVFALPALLAARSER
jgi:Zn-dependent protease with chaperone function